MPKYKDTVRAGVITLFKADERCRNDDLWLIFKYWSDIQKVPVYIPFDKMKDMAKPETIRRIRALIQNVEGTFLPTDEAIRNKRRISSIKWREWLGKARYTWGLSR